MGFLDRLLGRKRNQGESIEAIYVRDVDLGELEGKRASTRGDRLSLYESGLRALLEAKDGFIVFGQKDMDERFVQFAADSSSAGLTGEVGSEAVSDEAGQMLQDEMGFRPPDNSNPNYHQEFEEPDARSLAELVEKIYVDTLGCPDTYTLEVVACQSH